jgi:von Willebrand factor type A C-terminal domain/von Willebrand factor type A domain
MPMFTLECFQNEYLPEGASEVNAVVTITAADTAAGGDAATLTVSAEPAREVIIVDTSGSMGGSKIREARLAVASAIDCIRDGVQFAVIAGDDQARMLYPSTPSFAVASSDTRYDATRASGQLDAGGGTAIGSWISLATRLFAGQAGINHAILLTDGKDEHETPEQLDAALGAATGVFQCDCRGVGSSWVVSELRKVSTALLGTVDIIADPDGMSADFEAMMNNAMGKAVAAVNLRVWAPQGSTLEFVKQVSPDVLDLTATRVDVNPLSGDYALGAWGDEARDYHLAITVTPGNVGDEMLAARVTLMVGDEPSGQALVKAIWTDDAARSTRINRQVAHYTGQAELADAIQSGLEARKNGDLDVATARLGRAVKLAADAGNTETAELLAKVVDIEDASTGRVRLKSSVAAADEMTLDTRSTRTKRLR